MSRGSVNRGSEQAAEAASDKTVKARHKTKKKCRISKKTAFRTLRLTGRNQLGLMPLHKKSSTTPSWEAGVANRGMGERW